MDGPFGRPQGVIQPFDNDTQHEQEQIHEGEKKINRKNITNGEIILN